MISSEIYDLPILPSHEAVSSCFHDILSNTSTVSPYISSISSTIKAILSLIKTFFIISLNNLMIFMKTIAL